jgi:Predicted membrane protein
MKTNKQSGQALVTAAFAIVVLAGFAGLAIDMGALRYERRLQQTAADGAALAGASNITYSGVSTAAQNAAAQNGFTDNNSAGGCVGGTVGCVSVAANRPPTSGPHSGNTQYVEVIVATVRPTYFMKVFGVNSSLVSTRAVATNTGGGPAGGNGCIYTLGTPNSVLNVQNAGVGGTGNAILHAPTCGIVDNGNLVANGNIEMLAGSIGVGGDYNPPSQQGTCSPGVLVQGVCPAPVLNMPYSGDPFANKWPTAPGLSPGTVSTSGGVTTYTPGSYTDITVNSVGGTIFTPGVYVITGTFKINGGMKVCGGGTVADWNATPFCTYNGGVTFYIWGSGSSVQINGTSTVEMFAPNSSGLLFYQDPTNTNVMTLNGTNDSFFQGAVYAPRADIEFGGTGLFNSGASYTILVSDQLLVKGGPNVYLNSDLSGLSSSSPLVGALKWATLVE